MVEQIERKRRILWSGASGLLGALLYLAVSLGNWYGGRASAFDLGIFSQIAASWSAGGPPYSQIRGLPLFAEHFSPILAVTGLVWRLFPDPRALLVLQALLFAAALTLLTWHLSSLLRRVRLLLAVALGAVSYAVIAPNRFDFHEVAFAPLFVTLLIIGLTSQRLLWCIIGAVGLILTKEDLGFTVLAGAAVWALSCRDRRRPAVALAAIGVVGLVIGFGTIAWLNSRLGLGSTYLQRLGSTGSMQQFLLSLPQKPLPSLAFIAGCLVLGVRHRVALLAVPTLGWRAASSTVAYSQLGWHYDLVLWPVMTVCGGYALERWPDYNRARKGVVAGASFVTAALAVWQLAGSTPQSVIRPAAGLADIAALKDKIPAGSRVAAQDSIAAYVVTRFNVSVLDLRSSQKVDYVILEAWDVKASPIRAPLCSRESFIRAAEGSGLTYWRSSQYFLIHLPATSVPQLQRCE